MKQKKGLVIILVVLFVVAGVTTFLVLNNKTPELIDVNTGFEIDAVDSYKDRVTKLKDAQLVNKKVYGWISIPGTNVEYPVVFDEKNDNAYWESRDIKGDAIDNTQNQGNETVVYASRETKFLEKNGELAGSDEFGIEKKPSKNLVVFGHNWNNLREPFIIGNSAPETFKMFAQLPSFTDEKFAKDYQLVYFTTLDQERVYRVFSVMYTEPSWFEELEVEYIEENPTDEQMDVIINEMKKRSVFNFDMPVSKEDEIITLSTCTRFYPENKADQRYVVVAKLIDEKEAEDRVEVKVNEDVKKPNFNF